MQCGALGRAAAKIGKPRQPALAAGFDQRLTTDASLTVLTAEAQAAFTAALHGGRLDGCQRQDDLRLAISQALAALTGSADLL